MGKFQLAGTGDILLDEIGGHGSGDAVQAAAGAGVPEFERVGGRDHPLRAGITLTNQNLLAMSERRAFRADLYYRLSTIELYLPPPAGPAEDIPLLIDRLCAQREGGSAHPPGHGVPSAVHLAG